MITRRFYEQNYARCDNQGLHLGLMLTGGEPSDYTADEPLMEFPVAAPKALLANKVYDKTVLSFESFLNLAATRLWLKSFANAT